MSLLRLFITILFICASHLCEAQRNAVFQASEHSLLAPVKYLYASGNKIDKYGNYITSANEKTRTVLIFWGHSKQIPKQKNDRMQGYKELNNKQISDNGSLQRKDGNAVNADRYTAKYVSYSDTLTPVLKTPVSEKNNLINVPVKKIEEVGRSESLKISSDFHNILTVSGNVDSLIEAKFQTVSASVINNIKASISVAFKSIRKNGQLLPAMPKIESSALASLKKFKIGDAFSCSEVNVWETVSGKNIFLQNNVTANVAVAGIPVSATALYVTNFLRQQNNSKFTYKVNYNRNDFMEKLGISKNDVKAKMQEALNFKDQVNYKEIISSSFSYVPEINNIIGATGCKWDHLLEMPMEEFKKRYNKDLLKSKLADVQKLKDYYREYAEKTGDSLIRNKVNQADSQIVKLKEESELYNRLMKIKEQAEKLRDKVLELKKLYDEKVKILLDGYNVVKDIISSNNDLSGLQKFMLKVKGVNIGQHTISTGNLVLQHYLQNGISFEYETDRAYLLLTKGSQEKMETPANYFQQTVNSQNGLNEYYQFSNKYKLTGVSLGRGNKERSFQQVSIMNFNKIDNSLQPVLFAKNVTVFTIGNKYTARSGQRLSVDLSKSTVSQQSNTSRATNGSNASGSDFTGTLAAEVNYEFVNKQTQEMQKFKFFYSGIAYNNPGLNGGIQKPGLLLDHGISKKINKRISIENKFSYNSFRYGNSVSLKSLRDRVSASYKFRKMRVGFLINNSYINQLQYNPKTVIKTQSLDVLATGQTRKRFGGFFVNVNGGLGYGYNQQQSFNKLKNWSFYANAGIAYKGFNLDMDIDRFNTRNTEIFSTDSTTLVLVSSLNLQGMLSYSSKKGDIIQFGIAYKTLNNDASQLYITGAAEWRLFKRVAVSANLNLPVTSPVNAFFMNNTFNSKIIYNIKGHD